MMYPLVRDLAAEKIPVAVTCRVLRFSSRATSTGDVGPVLDAPGQRLSHQRGG